MYMYASGRCFYPKQLFHSWFTLSVHAFPGNWTHDLDVASTIFYCLSYNNAYSVYSGFDLNLLTEIVQKSDLTNLFFQI